MLFHLASLCDCFVYCLVRFLGGGLRIVCVYTDVYFATNGNQSYIFDKRFGDNDGTKVQI